MSVPLAEPGARDGQARLSDLPSVDRMLQSAEIEPLIRQHGRIFVTREIRSMLAELRAEQLRGEGGALRDSAGLAAALRARIEGRLEPSLRAVFNLTGTVLHTNLGRAPLADETIEAVARVLRAPSNLEFDLASGRRGERDQLIEGLVCELCGAEAATVVNNNASAVLLIAASLAGRREVLISRGELVEIGGSFRIPDVIRSAGARMVEVGTTNRTHARDFVEALSARTALIMKVHASNYVVTGFTASVDETQLAAIAHEAGLPFAIDLGSGSLVDLEQYGLPHEPTPQEALAHGADVVSFSGDKLLGGPQAGLIVGRRKWIDRIRKHPLKRALRVSKLTLAALEATLGLYRHPERLASRLPSLRLLTRPLADIEAAAQRLAGILTPVLGERFEVTWGPTSGQIGSGSLPAEVLASAGLFIRCGSPGRAVGRRLDSLAAALRSLPVPVIGRVSDDAIVLDLRALEDEATFVGQLTALDLQRIGA